MRQMAGMSAHSVRKLRYVINHWLDQTPVFRTEKIKSCAYAVFDGTFLHRPDSVIVLMDASDYSAVAGAYPVRENSIPKLKAFFQPLKNGGLHLKSATVDGNPQAIAVFKELWPEIIMQRCLVHIQRQGLMWCRIKPKMRLAQDFRKLFLRVTSIRTQEEKEAFIRDFKQWEQQYGNIVARFPSESKTLSDIKRARSMILNALSDMFHYLNNPRIPFSTNGLEGYFSRLKRHYGNHRGLAKHRLTNYFQWYIFLRSK